MRGKIGNVPVEDVGASVINNKTRNNDILEVSTSVAGPAAGYPGRGFIKIKFLVLPNLKK